MSNREWKPGDIGIVSDESGVERVAVRGGINPRMKHGWHYDEWGMGRILADIRPLVVIDPEDREQVERLGKAIYDNGFTAAGRLADALREFANPTPPKPDEPIGLGAVVEDGRGDRWVRGSDGPYEGTEESPFAVWKRKDSLSGTAPRSYNEIKAVRVLSEGVVA